MSTIPVPGGAVAVLGGADVGLGHGEHGVGVPGGAVAGPGHGEHGQAVVAQGFCEGGASSEIKQSLRCSAVIRSTVKCTDFEKKIYEEKSKAIYWKKIDEIFVEI